MGRVLSDSQPLGFLKSGKTQLFSLSEATSGKRRSGLYMVDKGSNEPTREIPKSTREEDLTS